MNKLIIIAALVATCLAIPAVEVDNNDKMEVLVVENVPLSGIDASGWPAKSDTASIDEDDLERITGVNALAEISRETRATNTTIKPKKLTLKDLIGRTSA